MRDRVGVFEDRPAAGAALAEMMQGLVPPDALVLAVPAGGVPVGVALAERLGLELDVAAISKITPPWNTEIGYGAVAFDGSVLLNQPLLEQMGLDQHDVDRGTDLARQKVARRLKQLRGEDSPLRIEGRTVVLVDDGLATGFTILCGCEALHRAKAGRIILAVPTAHIGSLGRVADCFHTIYCPNTRSGGAFAVADAYRRWEDVSESQARRALEQFRRTAPRPPGL